MQITDRQWLIAIGIAVLLHVLVIGIMRLGDTPPEPNEKSAKGVMISLDDFDSGPPPPTSIQNMPIQQLSANQSMASAPSSSPDAPEPAAEAPEPSAPDAAADIGPQPADSPDLAGAESSSADPSANPSTANGPTNSNASAGSQDAAIVPAVSVGPARTLNDVQPSTQVTARDAMSLPPSAQASAEAALVAHNGAYGDSNDATNSYIVTLRAWLARHREYPQTARRDRIEGTVRLYLVVNSQGQVLEHRIQRSSGSQQLDQAALDMLAHAEPLPAMPAGSNRNRLELIVPIVFHLRDDADGD